MRKLAVIICCSLLAFTAASLFVYRLGLGRRSSPEVPASRNSIVSEVNTAEGEVEEIDVGAGTLTLLEGDHEFTFTFDDRTAIVQSGQTVRPDSIEAGAGARVRYLKRGGKNWARRIELVATGNGDE